MSMHFLIPTSFVILTNAKGRSKLGLCSVRHSFRCCLRSDYVGEGIMCLCQLSERKKSMMLTEAGFIFCKCVTEGSRRQYSRNRMSVTVGNPKRDTCVALPSGL